MPRFETKDDSRFQSLMCAGASCLAFGFFSTLLYGLLTFDTHFMDPDQPQSEWWDDYKARIGSNAVWILSGVSVFGFACSFFGMLAGLQIGSAVIGIPGIRSSMLLSLIVGIVSTLACVGVLCTFILSA